MSSDEAARTLKLVLEVQAQGGTWDNVGFALKLPAGRERKLIAKKMAKEAARVSQRTLAEQGIGLA